MCMFITRFQVWIDLASARLGDVGGCCFVGLPIMLTGLDWTGTERQEVEVTTRCGVPSVRSSHQASVPQIIPFDQVRYGRQTQVMWVKAKEESPPPCRPG